MAEWRVEEAIKETQAIKEKIKARGLDAKNFCLVPFTTLILEPDGKVGICRHKGSNFPIGHIQKNTIAEIWNGEKARRWRREFLEGKPVFCATEVRHQHCHHCPENNKLLDYIELAEIQTQPILKLTANFNGKCNLQCQMCDIWQLPNGLYDTINFWGPAKKDIFPHLKEVDLLSGEPFIQTDTYRLINEITEVNSSCQWIFTTNVHWKLTEKIKMHLDKIHIRNIILSVDSFDPNIYKKIRYPGKLDFVLKNIDAFLVYNEERKKQGRNEIRFVLNFLTQKDNWHEIRTAIEYCESRGIAPFITFLYEPHTLSILNHPEAERIKIFSQILESLNSQQTVRSMRVLMPILDSLSHINRVAALYELETKTKN
jgi:radical SAM protein with 4Fe4S-binding SPASM domain